MTHGSLESGLGGFDYAADQLGWDNVFHCEINKFCQTILKYYWPNAESYTDIFEMDGTKWRGRVDIISAGFPCQPFSHAGKRKGTTDDRFIWPENLRIIKEAQPSFVVAENVPGLLTIENGMVFERVCADLENEGYEVTPFIVPACAKEAVHRRDRIWIVAYSRLFGQAKHEQQPTGIEQCITDVANPSEQGLSESGQAGERQLQKETGTGLHDRFKQCDRNDTNASGERTKRSFTYREQERQASPGRRYDNYNRESWLEAAARLCVLDVQSATGLDATAFLKETGISYSKWRNESLKSLGNTIMWQVAYEIFSCIQKTENELNAKSKTNA